MSSKKKPQAQPPDTENLNRLKKAAQDCTSCDLYKKGTQTVFGEGRRGSRLMLVGEQPGNQEDLERKPFVGPAGALLDELLGRAGIPREEVYVTNAVKHFKWVRSGKIRLHQKPNATEVRACRPWLEAEIKAVQPRVVLCLGTTAASSVFGRTVTLTKARGMVFRDLPLAPAVMVTWHPSAALRAPSAEDRARKKEQLYQDLVKAWRTIQRGD
jgi:DNA polymerase